MHESGYNPYAASGFTSASGLGQFILKTGKAYNLNDSNRWDINAQSNALVKYFIYNKNLAKNLSESYIYKFHHDGPIKNYGGLALSNKYILPKIGNIQNVIHKLF